MRPQERAMVRLVGATITVALFVIVLTANRALSEFPEPAPLSPTTSEARVSAAQGPELVAPSPSTSAVVTPERNPVGQVIATSSGSPLDVWYRLADCESGDWDRDGQPIPGTARWDAQGGGHEGGLQFLPSTWRQAGGNAVAGHAYEATAGEQITVARIWLGRTSVSQWPVCGPKVGLTMADALSGDDV